MLPEGSPGFWGKNIFQGGITSNISMYKVVMNCVSLIFLQGHSFVCYMICPTQALPQAICVRWTARKKMSTNNIYAKGNILLKMTFCICWVGDAKIYKIASPHEFLIQVQEIVKCSLIINLM